MLARASRLDARNGQTVIGPYKLLQQIGEGGMAVRRLDGAGSRFFSVPAVDFHAVSELVGE